jgi:N-carbamoyl-L-amino-acid hydrolase
VSPKDVLLEPDEGRLRVALDELAMLVEPDAPGWTREVFSTPYQHARDWIRHHMVEAGLSTSIDAAGNVVGVLPGRSDGPSIVIGSHTDTVHGGGRFDGIVGVLSAVEIARSLRQSGTVLEHELRVVDFFGEEANTFGMSCLGSRAITGSLSSHHLDLCNSEGERLGNAIEAFGIDSDMMLRATWSPREVGAFVELHVEQGPRLERSGYKLGVVTGIAGIERMMTTFTGRADHAGTMPMDERRDALVAASAAILKIEQTVTCSEVDAVATTGRLIAEPGALNVVPNKARMWTEIRSLDAAWLGSVQSQLVEEILDLARARGVECEVDWLSDQAPVPVPMKMQDLIARSIDDLGVKWQPVPSGAGHDAAHMARLAPTGMIFVPSRLGKSHCPEEWTDTSDIVGGVRALGATVRRLDLELDGVQR